MVITHCNSQGQSLKFLESCLCLNLVLEPRIRSLLKKAVFYQLFDKLLMGSKKDRDVKFLRL